MHCYLPGWEIPKFRPNFFTDEYGFITDYLSEFIRELRKISYADAFDKYFKLGNNFNQRDVIAVRKMVSSLVKLVYPHGKFEKADVEEILKFALECRRRVKEQLKRIGGMEFYDVNFSYIDNETFEETFVPVPEHGGGKLISEGLGKSGHVYTVGRSKSGMIGAFKLEVQVTNGSGKYICTGIGNMREAKESADTAYRYLKTNSKSISSSIAMNYKDFMLHVGDLNGVGMTSSLSLTALVALCSAALNRSAISSLAILGSLSIGGTITRIEELANVLQVCLDSGAKKVLVPISSAIDMGSVPPELMGKFNIIFYGSPEDAVFKALGVE
jgi:ATP-dependent Lon protease